MIKLPFDKCYCLHLAESTDRYDNLINEFNKLGITDQVNIWWTCKRDISDKIGDSLETLHSNDYDYFRNKNHHVYGNVFNCSFEHYTIVKQAYLRGFNSILVFEDDFYFNENVDFEKLFNEVPKDFDVIRYYMHPAYNGFNSDPEFAKCPDYSYVKTRNIVSGTNMYALSRKGMEWYISCMDNEFGYADKPYIYINKTDPDRTLNQYIVKHGVIKSNLGCFKSEIN